MDLGRWRFNRQRESAEHFINNLQFRGGLKMTDYYIIHETPFGTERSLYQKVERRMAENDQELADRCNAIIEQVKKQYLGNFFFADDTYLETTNQTHLREEG